MNVQEWIVLGGVFVFALVVTLVPIVGGLLHARRERLLVHSERMKALEWGIVLPAKASPPAAPATRESMARQCFSTAFWVAFWGFASAAGLGSAEVSTGVAYAIAAAAGSIGVTSVICGTVLSARIPVEVKPNSFPKSMTDVDADAYDVVSCRG
jgi:hypothetical protein